MHLITDLIFGACVICDPFVGPMCGCGPCIHLACGSAFARTYPAFSMEERVQTMQQAMRAAVLRSKPEAPVVETEAGCCCTAKMSMTTLVTELTTGVPLCCWKQTETFDTSSVYDITAVEPPCCSISPGLLTMWSSNEHKPKTTTCASATVKETFQRVVDSIIVPLDVEAEAPTVFYQGPGSNCCDERYYDITSHRIIARVTMKQGCLGGVTYYRSLWMPLVTKFELVSPPSCYYPGLGCCPKAFIRAHSGLGSTFILAVPNADVVFKQLVAQQKKRLTTPFYRGAAIHGVGQLLVPASTPMHSWLSLAHPTLPHTGPAAQDFKQGGGQPMQQQVVYAQPQQQVVYAQTQ